MRRIANARTAALVSALMAGALAAYSLRPSSAGTTHLTQQPTEVRTQVIRRTVKIVRHERPRGGHATPRTSVRHTTQVVPVVGAAPRSATSGSHAASAGTLAAPVARTRTSPSTAAPSTGHTPSTGAAGAPVRSRTSGVSTGAPRKEAAGTPVRTRTSGASTGSGKERGAPRTRTSGGEKAGHDD